MTTTRPGRTEGLRLMTLKDAADRLDCSMKTLRRRIAAGALPVIRDGRLVRVHPDDLDRYIKSRRSF